MASAASRSNTTYIESAAGVAEGGRTGFASVVTGVLFLFAIFLSPLAGIIQATAPALVLVGYLMFTQLKDIDLGDVEDGYHDPMSSTTPFGSTNEPVDVRIALVGRACAS